MRTSSLTPTHERIARAILNLERRHEPAFVSDLVRNLGYAAESSLTATLHLMERKGFLLLQGGGARGRSRVARLTTQGRMAIGAGGIPLLGFIPAGPLTEALQQADDFVEPEELFPYRDGDFLLRVKGDSMIGDGILDGDKVLLRPASKPAREKSPPSWSGNPTSRRSNTSTWTRNRHPPGQQSEVSRPFRPRRVRLCRGSLSRVDPAEYCLILPIAPTSGKHHLGSSSSAYGRGTSLLCLFLSWDAAGVVGIFPDRKPAYPPLPCSREPSNQGTA